MYRDRRELYEYHFFRHSTLLYDEAVHLNRNLIMQMAASAMLEDAYICKTRSIHSF